MSTDNLIAMPHFGPADLAGALIYWRLRGTSNHKKLEDAWVEAALDPKLLPTLPSERVALQRAVRDQRTAHRFIRKHPQDGWLVVDELPDDSQGLEFAVDCHVQLGNQELGLPLKIEPNTHPAIPALVAAYRTYRGTLITNDITSWLTNKIMKDLDAVSLRDMGGVYFIPQPRVPLMKRMVTVIHEVTMHKVFTIPAVKDYDAIDAVLDAITREAESEAADLEAALGVEPEYMDMLPEEIEEAKAQAGKESKKPLGPRALRSRAEHCEQVMQKVGRYEELLGLKLTNLRERLERLGAASVEAALKLEHDAQHDRQATGT